MRSSPVARCFAKLVVSASCSALLFMVVDLALILLTVKLMTRALGLNDRICAEDLDES